MLRCACITATALALAVPAVASAKTVTVPGWPDAAGPNTYDRTTVTQYGPSSAKTVLVLIPGTQGGAGNFSLIGPELASRVKGLQVWAWDRRESAIEDHKGLKGSALNARRYYLDSIVDSSITPRHTPPNTKDLGFAREWGWRTQFEDLRRVIARAKKGGRKVILGGHSLGASMADGYAAWDFNGRPGYKDLVGVMNIDGGLFGPPNPSAPTLDAAAAEKNLADYATADPFLDLLGLGIPWVTGAFSAIGGKAAAEAPDAPSIFADFALLPPAFKPPVPSTNEGQFGYALDASTSPESLALIHVRAGRLGPDGRWIDGEVSTMERVAKMFSADPDGAEWFFPRRMSIDSAAASQSLNGLSPAAKVYGLRVQHARKVDVPLYAIQTSLSQGRVKAAAERWAKGSKIGTKRLTVVDASKTMSHLDPLTAVPSKSVFMRTAVPWLKKLAAPSRKR